MNAGSTNSVLLFCFFAWAIATSCAHAQDAGCENSVVATVDGESVSLNEVHYFLDRTLKNLPGQASRDTRSQQTIQIGIEHCIKRLVVLQFLRSGKFKTTKQEIDFDLDDMVDQLAKTDLKLEDYLGENQLTEAELRRELEWNGSWRKYARKYITEEHLRLQFDKNRLRYDGTQLKVSQILWKSSDASTVELAKEVRSKLVDGKLTWHDAVSEHSQAASAKDFGDLGWITFSGPMMPEFNKVAYDLKRGEISKPLKSKFGTHLIRCDETKPGDKSFEDVAVDLRDKETNRLFELLAKKYSSIREIVRHSTSK